MTTVGTVDTAGGNAAFVRAAAAAPKTSEVANAPAIPAAKPISPSYTVDPLAGQVILQFRGAGEDAALQIPSRAAIAYLRAGLTAQGFPNPVEQANKKKDAETTNPVVRA